MDKLDRLVTEHLVERLFEPTRLTEMLSSLAGQRAEKEQSLDSRIAALQREVSDANEKLKRLHPLIEDGVTDLDDVLKDRLNGLKAERERAKAALERAKSYAGGAIQLDPALVEGFGRLMREHLTTGSIPLRKAYLQSIVDSIEVDDAQIRIRGSKDVLEKAVLASRSGAMERSQMSTRWRAIQNKAANSYTIEITL